MKNFLALLALALLLTATAARAGHPLTPAFEGASSEFVKRYELTSFNIATDSLRLQGVGEVESGTVEINEATKQLRIVLNRRLECEAGMLCPAVMPFPTMITLPIRHTETNICGGLTLVAERNLQLVDRGFIRVEVQDMAGTRCAGSDLLAVVRKVKVIVTEEGMRDRREVMSVMSGSLAQD
jgi:hypothetical protein